MHTALAGPIDYIAKLQGIQQPIPSDSPLSPLEFATERSDLFGKPSDGILWGQTNPQQVTI